MLMRGSACSFIVQQPRQRRTAKRLSQSRGGQIADYLSLSPRVGQPVGCVHIVPLCRAAVGSQVCAWSANRTWKALNGCSSMNSKTIRAAAASGGPAMAVSASRGRAGAGAAAPTYQQGRTPVRATERRGGCATVPAPQRIPRSHRPDRTPTPAGNPSAPPTNADDLGRGLTPLAVLTAGGRLALTSEAACGSTPAGRLDAAAASPRRPR